MHNQHICWRWQVKRGVGMALSKQFETTSFAVTHPCSLSVVSCRILDGVELSKNTRVDHRAFAVSSAQAPLFISKPARRREFTHVLLPESVEFYVVKRGGKKPSNSCLPRSIPKHMQIDEAFAEMVAKITEAATQRETFRALVCRPSKWWTGPHAWSALQRKRFSLRKFRSDRWQWSRAAFVMFRSAIHRGVVDLSNVQEAADIFFMCQRVSRWSKAHLMRVSHESKTLVIVDREAHFRSLTEQAKAAEYHGNVKVLCKLTGEAAGKSRIELIPSITMDDNATMTMGSAQTNERWRQSFAKLLQGRVTALADLRTSSTRRLQRAGSCSQDVRLSPNKRCVQQSCARKMARVQVSTTFL